MPTMVMMGLMFVGFYFLMIRPQMKKAKQEKGFQAALKVGSRVVTTGWDGTVSTTTRPLAAVSRLGADLAPAVAGGPAAVEEPPDPRLDQDESDRPWAFAY